MFQKQFTVQLEFKAKISLIRNLNSGFLTSNQERLRLHYNDSFIFINYQQPIYLIPILLGGTTAGIADMIDNLGLSVNQELIS